MRGYECHYYSMLKDDTLIQIANSSCWKGIDTSNIRYKIDVHNCQYAKDLKFNEENKDYIFISRFEEGLSQEVIERLVFIINKITPCEIVIINNINYIKYKLLDSYAKNLVLLNFIRKLWYKPSMFKHEEFFKDIFKDLKYKEPLRFLMTCLRDNVKPNLSNDNDDYAGYGGHSNVYTNIIPKTRKRLFEYQGNVMSTFLKQK